MADGDPPVYETAADVRLWPGYMLLAQLSRIRQPPSFVLLRVTQWLSRWLLRLTLPILCINAMVHALPYSATVDGVPFRVQATVLTHPVISADTSFGSWEFTDFDGLPVGVHVSPVDLNLLALAREAGPDTATYVAKLKKDFSAQLPAVAWWLATEILIGLLAGLALAAALNMATRYLGQLPRRVDELAHRARQLGAALVVTLLVAGYGALSFNPNWIKQSRLTGTLGVAQLFPEQLQLFYDQQGKVYDTLGAVVGIQAALQQEVEQANAPQTAFKIMFISDVHLAAVYPLVAQYAQNFDVKLIINTGDESEFGSSAEMTPTFVNSIANLTARVPMLWLAGNHDSPDVVSIMRSIHGVTVLGDKTLAADGSYRVSASTIQADGLTIGAMPDPRVYGAPGAYGSAVDAETDPLEKAAVNTAVKDIPTTANFDIFATHEPVAAHQLTLDLSGQIRQTNSGHTHVQNSPDDVHSGSTINLVEGSTGAGGLDNLNRKTPAPPIEFSIESVAPNCQFTMVVRFQLADPASPSSAATAPFGTNVSASTIFFSHQSVAPKRTCSASDGIGDVRGFG